MAADLVLANDGIQFANGSIQPAAAQPQIAPVGGSVAGNALSIAIAPCSLGFRSTIADSGAVTYVANNTTLTLTVPSGATLGTTNAVASRIVILALNNAGTIEPAVVNIAGGVNLDETGLISTTAIDTASDSATVVYSTTARTNVAYRVVGFVESTQATAGTWATTPSKVQGVGGQALTAMSSLGYGQTWQNVTGSRAFGTTYYNTTGKPICVFLRATMADPSNYAIVTVNGIAVSGGSASNTNASACTAIVPPAGSYVLSAVSGSLHFCAELR